MDPRRARSLARLAQLAALTREAELAKLAAVAQSRARLQSALDTVRKTEAPLDPAEAIADPAMIGARLAHRRWSEVQQRRLNQQLALVSADWLRQKPAAARAFGRAAVLDALSQKAHTDLRTKNERKT
ncbi:hypothetical protein [Pararhodobacter zhoushanensis]|uniref:hypothetical protein n=1 Tax=Pararhodobacter zhoushanensis TaxID=2479545 RepID=UPI000F8C43CD|nr:hypothetical protein [Pararhodobacter zhoushanensis]